MHGHMNVTMHGHMNFTMHGNMNVTMHGHMNIKNTLNIVELLLYFRPYGHLWHHLWISTAIITQSASPVRCHADVTLLTSVRVGSTR
jgi:hypothetical protein